MNRMNLIVALAAFLALAGCESQPEIPFDRSANANIHRIGILTPGMPEKPTVWLASDVGKSFGFVGAVIDSSLQDARDNRLWTMLVERHMVPRNELVGDMIDSLRAQGFDAKFVRVYRPLGDYVTVYPSAAETDVDAYLDISGIKYGYVAAGIGDSTPYRPYIYTTFRLVRAGDGEVLMQDTIYYNPVEPLQHGNDVTISPDPSYSFVDFDMMKRWPDQSVDGIKASFRSTADALSHLLH